MSILDDLVRLQFGKPIKESAADIIQAINTQKQMKEMPDIISNIENALTATNEQTESGTTPGTSTSQLGRIGNVLSATLEGVKKLQEAGGNTQLVNTPIALSSLILSGLSSGANIEGTLAGAQEAGARSRLYDYQANQPSSTGQMSLINIFANLSKDTPELVTALGSNPSSYLENGTVNGKKLAIDTFRMKYNREPDMTNPKDKQIVQDYILKATDLSKSFQSTTTTTVSPDKMVDLWKARTSAVSDIIVSFMNTYGELSTAIETTEWDAEKRQKRKIETWNTLVPVFQQMLDAVTGGSDAVRVELPKNPLFDPNADLPKPNQGGGNNGANNINEAIDFTRLFEQGNKKLIEEKQKLQGGE
jgi:hypothetical protein